MLDTSSENGFFLGELHNEYIDLLLPDWPGFLYYSDALEDLPVIFDTSTLVSVSPDWVDFINYKPIKNGNLTNITGEGEVVRVGTIQWKLYDDEGKKHIICTRGYYVPISKVHLFSVQSYLGLNKGSFVMEGDLTIFSFNDGKMLTLRTYNRNGQKSFLYHLLISQKKWNFAKREIPKGYFWMAF